MFGGKHADDSDVNLGPKAQAALGIPASGVEINQPYRTQLINAEQVNLNVRPV